MRKFLKASIVAASMLLGSNALASEEYIIDTKGAHASIEFKIKHLGYSWLTGRFNDFEGAFSIDRDNLESSNVTVTIDPASIDSNHEKRDEHLRGEDFLDVEKFPSASFKSTSITLTGEETATVKGDLTLHGVTQPIVIDAALVGEGKDPWGGYRLGLTGTTSLALKDFGIDYDLGPASTHVDMTLNLEGIRQ